MRLAILLMVHKNIEQVKMLTKALSHPNIMLFIHTDKKMTATLEELRTTNIVILPDDKRVDVKWAQISQVDATLNLIEVARASGNFDYFWLCSGQDFPLVSSTEILNFLKNGGDHNYINFFTSKENQLGKNNHYDKRNQIIFPKWLISPKINRRLLKRLYVEVTGGYNHTFYLMYRKDAPCKHFYFGATWWCLNKDTVDWMAVYIKDHPEYYRFFTTCLCPDESFFHTLVMMSPYKNEVEDYLHYVDWSEGKSSPRTFKSSDYEAITHSGKLMARKFDICIDKKILDDLTDRVVRKDNS